MQQAPDTIKIPSVVKAELLFGAVKSNRDEENKRFIQRFLKPFEIVPFDDDATTFYATIRSQTESKGTPVGPNDLIIAATVLSRGGVLVTNNTKEFEHIQGLRIENWVA